MPARLNQPDLNTLATVTRAIHGGTPLQLTYHSMKTGAVSRVIVPHALVDSGLRWHVRAYDRTRGEFRDLVLTRMEQVELLKASVDGMPDIPAHESLRADAQWNKALILDLVPHPAHLHPLSIEKDFGMRGGRLAVTLRAATAGYVLRQWQVDCSPDACLRGVEFRLWLADSRQLEGVDNAVLAPGFRPLRQMETTVAEG
jgi:predicted DNA-binding transcriptional regulator YafY